MSNTDKDKPYWVTAVWWEADHWLCENDVPRRWYRGGRTCDLPDRPVRQHPEHRRTGRCTWQAEWPFRDRYRYTRPPTREERRAGWHGPQRAAVRDECHAAVAEYRGSGRVDTIPTTRQHRHSPLRRGWWD